MNVMELRGLVFSKYRNTTQFAKAIGWSRQKTRRILEGIQEPTLQDVVTLTETLDIIGEGKFFSIFFTPLFTKYNSEMLSIE